MSSSPSLTSTSPSLSSGSMVIEAATKIKNTFKFPTGSAKRKKTRILEEETYVEQIGNIIERDFFPDLGKLKTQNEYIDAIEHNDTKRIIEIHQKHSLEQSEFEILSSPATFETPHPNEINIKDTPVSVTSKNKGKKFKTEDQKVSLDKFLSNNTSEDNISFEQILRENEKNHRLKNTWLYKTENIIKPEFLPIENHANKLLAIKSKEKKPFEINTWNYKNKNYLMYIPDGVDLTIEEKIEFAKKKQEVVHKNTRLKIKPFNEQQNQQTINELAKIQSKINDGKIGVDGKEIIRVNTPKINGFTFVRTPSPLPNDTIDSPIMTWGQIDGSPFRLSGGDTPLLYANSGPSFRMAEPPKREKLALQLAEKTTEKKRDKKIKVLNAAQRSLTTPSPRSTIDKLCTMSPAARRLAAQKLRLSFSQSPNGMFLKIPLVEIKTPILPKHSTPSIKSINTDTNAILKSQSVLTDNLLNLPNISKRKKAADFF